MIAHTLTIQYQSPTGTVSNTLSASGDANLELNLTIAALASSAETDLSISESALQSFFLLASAAMTVAFKTGTGGSGTTVASFTLLAGVAQFWVVNNGANPFTGNAGQMLVTSTAGGSLQVRALLTE